MASWKLPFVSEPLFSVCVPAKYEYIWNVPNMILKDKFMMSNCAHNEFVGLRNRYLKQLPFNLSYDKVLLKQIVLDLALKIKPHFKGVQTITEFFEGRTGGMKKRYFDAVRKIADTGFRINKHNKCGAFIKNELYDELKPPRMIINRDPRFNLAYSKFTLPLEHAIMNIPQFAKGKNYLQRGECFKDLIHGQWILEGDCSKFEASQRLELLVDIELQLWRYLLNDDEYRIVEKLFWAKMSKAGYTANGCRFSFYSMRGSGDMDTGLFNSILMFVACRYFEIENNTFNYNFIVDGDDNLLKLPTGMTTYVNSFSKFGFDAKLFVRKDHWTADFCSGRFLQINHAGDFMYFQDIRRIMNNMSVFRKTKFKHCKDTYYHSLGYMYKKIYGEIPMYKDFAEYLMRGSRTKASMSLLSEINPIYPELIDHTSNGPKIDDYIVTELMMSFDITTGEMECIKTFCKGNLSLGDSERRRYRPETKTTQLERTLIQHMSDYLENELRRC